MSGEGPAAGRSADRRTGLAGERTLLAWWRTGLTAIAVALAVGRLLPELTPDSTRWPYALLGAGFAIYGIAMLIYGTQRMGLAARSKAEVRALTTFTVAGVVLGLGTMVLIFTQ